MELAQLQAFAQVAHHRSFSRAADALFLTQPSVTARIQSLERELGARLFERTGRSVKLTDAGHAFMPHAQRVLTSVQEGVDAIEAVRHGEVGSIRIGASPTIATYMLPRILKRFRERRPRVHVHLSTGTSEEVIERLTGGDVHIAICRLTQHPEIEATHLYNDDLALVVSPSHAFTHRRAVTTDELSREPFLFFERSASYHGLIYGTLLRMGVVPESVMELDSMETTKHMVESNLGIAVLPVVSVAREVEDGRLRLVDINGMEQPPQREVGAHVIRNRTLSAPAEDLMKLLREHFAHEDTGARA